MVGFDINSVRIVSVYDNVTLEDSVFCGPTLGEYARQIGWMNHCSGEPNMQVEAIYNQGRIEFVQPLRLKHERFRLLVNVPDDELETESAPLLLTAQASAQLRQEQGRPV